MEITRGDKAMSELTWSAVLGSEKQQSYFTELLARVAAERAAGVTVYPPAAEVFNAFRYCALADLRVVIIGQDPYHGDVNGVPQAHGLSFSVPEGLPPPPSLRNIFKALQHDYPGYQPRHGGNLQHWAEQGVLLLNTVLTVQQGQANSHAGWGWERFTDHVIEVINQQCQGVVFLLWGSHAQRKAALIDSRRHHLLETVHPSPLSAHRGFLTAAHFRRCNELLGERAIDW